MSQLWKVKQVHSTSTLDELARRLKSEISVDSLMLKNPTNVRTFCRLRLCRFTSDVDHKAFDRPKTEQKTPFDRQTVFAYKMSIFNFDFVNFEAISPYFEVLVASFT